MLVDADNSNADLCDVIEVLSYGLVKCKTIPNVAITSTPSLHKIEIEVGSTVYPA